MTVLVRWILILLGWFPLPVLHAVAAIAAPLAWLCMPTVRHRIHENLAQAGQKASFAMTIAVFRHTIAGALELAPVWTRSSAHLTRWCRHIEGREYLDDAIARQQALLFIMPHLGSFDWAGRMLSEMLPFPLTAMFRPPKKDWFLPIMEEGRCRANGRTAPATLQGVRILMKALRRHEAVVVLPDQVPKAGEGVWVDFFARPAYTMTLAARLAAAKDVCPLMVCAQRLPFGRGFVLHIEPLSGSLSGDVRADAERINQNVEGMIGRFPEQYLFGYNRYKGRPPKG